MTWHDDATTRQQIGDSAESKFSQIMHCACGGRFQFVGNIHPGFPDFTCENCGLLVDIKSSPQSERTGNIAVSVIPWEHYPDDMLLATIYRGQWVAEYKFNIHVSGRKDPTHTTRPTQFYLISCKQLKPIHYFGLKEQEMDGFPD